MTTLLLCLRHQRDVSTDLNLEPTVKFLVFHSASEIIFNIKKCGVYLERCLCKFLNHELRDVVYHSVLVREFSV
jgi:hypothetical protein